MTDKTNPDADGTAMDAPRRLYVQHSDCGEHIRKVSQKPFEGGVAYDPAPVWQPIETAPRDGTRILAFAKGNKRARNENARIDQIRVDRRVERYGWKYARQLPEALYIAWMPLPAGPEEV